MIRAWPGRGGGPGVTRIEREENMISRWSLIPVVVLAALLFACGGEEPADQGDHGATTAGDEGGGETPVVASGVQESKDAFTRIQEAWANRDFGALYGMLGEGTRARIDGWVAMVKKQFADLEAKAGPLAEVGRQALAAKFGKGAANLDELSAEDAGAYAIEQLWGDDTPDELEGELQGDPVVDGDTATLTLKKPDGSTGEVEMVKEGGEWRVDVEK
jgi:hypothetical protein